MPRIFSRPTFPLRLSPPVKYLGAFLSSLPLALLAPVLTTTSAPAAAQQNQTPATAQTTGQPTAQNSAQTPPGTQRIEPGSDQPNRNIPRAPGRDGTKINETRDNAGMTTVDVTTPGGSHYTMKPNTQAGSGSTLRPPQWKVGEFDLSGKRHATSESGTNAPTAADAPPPPPMPATAGSGTK